jgi:hypothetical protein
MMAHECPTCGQACYCDGEDTWLESSEDDCVHDCDPEDLRDDDETAD